MAESRYDNYVEHPGSFIILTAGRLELDESISAYWDGLEMRLL